ncbi:MAG TPA: hypothetical protein VIE47_06810 [Methylocystis sp.]
MTGGPQFTHMAGHHAGIVIRNALFHLPSKSEPKAVPWVTYTDPELAQVGLHEARARERHGDDVRVLRADFSDNDRARAEGETQGFLKAMVTKRGRVAGATIVGRNAGELIFALGSGDLARPEAAVPSRPSGAKSRKTSLSDLD